MPSTQAVFMSSSIETRRNLAQALANRSRGEGTAAAEAEEMRVLSRTSRGQTGHRWFAPRLEECQANTMTVRVR